MAVANIVTELQDQVIDTVRSIKEPVTESVRAWSEGVSGLLPDLPELPIVDQLPSPQELVSNSFTFAERLLQVQRDLVVSVLDAAGAGAKVRSGNGA